MTPRRDEGARRLPAGPGPPRREPEEGSGPGDKASESLAKSSGERPQARAVSSLSLPARTEATRRTGHRRPAEKVLTDEHAAQDDTPRCVWPGRSHSSPGRKGQSVRRTPTKHVCNGNAASAAMSLWRFRLA